MRRLALLAVGLPVLAACTPRAAVPAPAAPSPAPVTVITGTVTGRDGQPLPLAYVSLNDSASQRVTTTRAGADGTFTLAYGGAGPAVLHFEGVGHEEHGVELYLREPAVLALDVRLAAARYRDSLSAVRVIGDFNRFAHDSTARPLARQPDGTWRLELPVKADSLAYQLLGVHRYLPVANPGAARFVRHADDGFAAVAEATHGRVTIVLDPARLARDTARADVRFRDSTQRAARLATILGSMDDRFRRMTAGLRRVASADSAPRLNWDAEAAALERRIDAERDPLVRRFLLVELMEVAMLGGQVASRYGELALREVPPDSPLWMLSLPRQFSLVVQPVYVAARKGAERPTLRGDTAAVRRLQEVGETALAARPNGPPRRTLLIALVESLAGAGAGEASQRYLAQLVREFPGDEHLGSVLAQYGADRVLQVNRPMPAFRFASMDEPGRVFTREALRGKVVLLDFWATWCAPCIAEMPVLHRAYELYGPKGLEIVSISADASPEVVRRFRQGKWAMPWLHSFVAGGLESDAFKSLEISFLPRAVLVDAAGQIVAVDTGLRGDELFLTLERALP